MSTSDRYDRAHDLDSWRSDRRIAGRGFVHPWLSRVDEGNGEDFFVAALSELAGPDDVVLGGKELTLRHQRLVARFRIPHTRFKTGPVVSV